jgi:secondary thiamine-phosphate synthase enzyme
VRLPALTVKTERREQIVLLRERIDAVLAKHGAKDGLLHVFSTHTSAGVTVNEGWDPDVLDDFLGALEKAVPTVAGYKHAEGNAAAHVKTSLVGAEVTVPVRDGKLALGQWQNVYLCEFDGPRTRTLALTFMEA